MVKTIVLSAAIVLLATSCEKELDFKYNDIEPLTVIEGELTPDGSRVSITLTTPMDEPMDRTRLTDATVTLTDLTDDITLRLTPDADGYFTDPTPGIDTHRYLLTVDRNGEIRQAVTEMFAPVEITSLEFSWIEMPYDDVAVLQGQFVDDPAVTGQYYWVKFYRNDDIYAWGAVDDRTAVDGECTALLMTTRRDTDEEDDDKVLYDGDVMTMTVCPVTKEMHDYLEALQNSSNGPAMFSGPLCLGYFMASSPVSRSVVFHPDEIPVEK